MSSLDHISQFARNNKCTSVFNLMPSTTSKIAAAYACKDDEVPEVLWRVQYPNSSLKARTKPSFKTESEFKKAVELHLDWDNRDPTPFVSLFESKKHAVNWAKYHLERRYDNVSFLKINTSELGLLFRVRDLVRCKLVQTWLPKEWYDDEFLVLREIPRRSIMRTIYMSRVEDYLSEDSDISSVDPYSESYSDSDVSDTFDG